MSREQQTVLQARANKPGFSTLLQDAVDRRDAVSVVLAEARRRSPEKVAPLRSAAEVLSIKAAAKSGAPRGLTLCEVFLKEELRAEQLARRVGSLAVKAGEWKEDLHPRNPAGGSKGGKFAAKPESYADLDAHQVATLEQLATIGFYFSPQDNKSVTATSKGPFNVVMAADAQMPHTLLHSLARDKAEAEYRRTVAKAVAVMEASLLAAREKEEAERAKAKRRKELLALLALIFLVAGARIYRSLANQLWPAIVSPPPAPGPAPGPAPAVSLQPSSVSAPTPYATDPDEARDFSQGRVNLLDRFLATSVDRLERALAQADEAGMSADEAADRLATTAKDIEAGTGAVVAQTEAQSAYGAAVIRIIRQAGFTHKVWVTMEDEKVRPSHVECGEQGALPMDQPFANGLQHPGDPAGGPEEVCNCRCWLVGQGRPRPVMASTPHNATEHQL